MSDYETFRQWAAEADDRINGRMDLSHAYITGLPALELINWNDPKKAAFMAAIAARRRLKIALDRLNADGLAYEAMVAMNILDESAYGYIDYDDYDDDYPWPGAPPQQPANMFSHENEQFTPYMYSDDLSDSLRALITAPSRGFASVWRCEAQTAEPAPECTCTVSLGTEDAEEDQRAWAVGDSITFKFNPQPARKVYLGNGKDLLMPVFLSGLFDQPCQVERVFNCAVTDSDDGQHQSPLDAIGEDVLNTVIAPVKQGKATAKPQAHTGPYFSEDEQRDMEPVEVWCKPSVGKPYRHCVRPRKAAEELVERNNSQYRGIAEYWIEP